MATMAERLALAFLFAAAAALAASAVDTKLTLQNLCPFPVHPLVTPNGNFSSISDNTVHLDPNRGLVSFPFPDTFWAGSVVARTFCRTPTSCDTGSSPPRTVVQLAVHSTEDLATYSVSLEDGFNLATVVTPLFSGGGQCPALGCPLNLTNGCPVDQVKFDDCGVMVACKGDPGYFKRRCPLTRVNGTDREPLPQSCIAPRELKVVFCQKELAHLTMVGAASAQTELAHLTMVGAASAQTEHL
ncbi:osmotin-like protein [Lolium perenne]|uniref:osmotin-like protein n=1 Tax=Lolium perenne TaxID=4522 RepID=UPI0021EA8689|nr:osmotin-like protein [Lolium perenne]